MNDLNKDMEWIFKREAAVIKEAEENLISEKFSKEQLLPFYIKLANEYRKLLKQNVKLVALGDVEHKYLFQIQSELKSILDNTRQGIFTTDENFHIDSKYSVECMKIFGQPLENKRFTDLIRSYNSKDTIEIIEQVLSATLFFESDQRRDIMLMLLPEEIRFQQKILSMVCRVISDESGEAGKSRFLFLLTDISEKKQLENQMNEKQKLINTIIKIVSDNSLFKNCAKAFRDFLADVESQAASSIQKNSEELKELLRQIHTFKGDFSIFELEELVCCLHGAEQQLMDILKAGKELAGEDFRYVTGLEKLKAVFEGSIEQLRSKIGDSYFDLESDKVTIERSTLKSLVAKAYPGGLDTEAALNDEIRKICQVDFMGLLRSYPDYTVRLAERSGKSLRPFELEGPPSLFVDEGRYSSFARALVHVFRNAVVHGIEEPEERVEAGKEEIGNITCRIWETGDYINIEISDDGRGIDVESIKKKASEMRLLPEVDGNANENQLLMSILLSDGFSTSDKPDQFSGRGEGLAAVRHELALLNGRAFLETARGKGTVFRFEVFRA